MYITYLKASSDVNGNPRRGWLVDVPARAFFIDESHAGMSNIYYWLGSAYHPNCPSNYHGHCEECWVHGSSIYWNFAVVKELKVKVSEYETTKRFYS